MGMCDSKHLSTNIKILNIQYEVYWTLEEHAEYKKTSTIKRLWSESEQSII